MVESKPDDYCIYLDEELHVDDLPAFMGLIALVQVDDIEDLYFYPSMEDKFEKIIISANNIVEACITIQKILDKKFEGHKLFYTLIKVEHLGANYTRKKSQGY